MNKILIFALIGIIIGLLSGLLGIPLHNYEVEKCKVVSSNSYYEAQAGCYKPLNKPELNLFFNVIIISILGMVFLGLVGALIGIMIELNQENLDE